MPVNMGVQELYAAQRAHAARYLTDLYQLCARRYIEAARLLEINSPYFDNLSRSLSGRIDVGPLLEIYLLACKRYNNEIYSPQIDLWSSIEHDPLVKWSEFYHQKLKTVWARNDYFVRNVLRVIRAIPCNDLESAHAALKAEVTNMEFGNGLEMWELRELPAGFYGNIQDL